MAKKTSKKKVVSAKIKTTLSPTASKSRSIKKTNQEPLLFGKQNYYLLLGGALAMAIGFILMSGGEMPDPNTWDEDIIYGTRRIVVAPFMLLTGLVIMVFAIFKKESHSDNGEPIVNQERVVNQHL